MKFLPSSHDMLPSYYLSGYNDNDNDESSNEKKTIKLYIKLFQLNFGTECF